MLQRGPAQRVVGLNGFSPHLLLCDPTAAATALPVAAARAGPVATNIIDARASSGRLLRSIAIEKPKNRDKLGPERSVCYDFLRNAASTCFLMSPKFRPSVLSSSSVRRRNGTRTTLCANFTFSQYWPNFVPPGTWK